MTDPLSPEEIARRRTASYFVEPADAGEEMRRLLDIAEDHARLVAENADLNARLAAMTEVGWCEVYTSSTPAQLVEENTKLRERVGRLRKALHELVTRCDSDEGVRADGSNIQTMAAHAALAACEEEDSK